MMNMLTNISYFNMLVYLIIGYIFYYIFSISFVSIAFLIIGIVIGSYLTTNFKLLLF